ncbi:MAG TPA: FeoB-associated Cys-rich membrane protein [Verrucomicrobiae bacterium]
MNWQQFLILAIVLAVVVFSVWRSSSKKSGCGCGCAHDHETGAKKEKSAAH